MLVPLNNVDEAEVIEGTIQLDGVVAIDDVQPREAPKKLEAGIYIDDEGKYFRVTTNGELVELDA